jgi:hypothetical protein
MSSRTLARIAVIAALVGGGAAAAAAPNPASFEASIQQHGWSASTLLGLGNAYESAGQHGLAVLALERAHLLAPRDAAVTESLAQARTAAGVPQPDRSRVEDALSKLTTDEWTWIALAGGVLACLGLAGVAWRVRPALTRTFIVAGTVVALGAAIAGSIVAPPADRAIVTSTSTARISPFPAAQGVFEALEGESVHIEKERSEFFFVRDGDRSGWLPRASVQRVIPESS